MNTIKRSLEDALDVLARFISDEKNLDNIQKAAELMIECILSGGKIISIGNGGSMSDAMHFAEEMTGNYRENRKALPAIAISDPSHLSCVANDYGYDFVFSRSIQALGKPGDVLLAISTSGNSKNIVKDVEVAKETGMKVISLTGNDGGKLAVLSDVEIRAPHSGYSDRIQEVHIKIIHVLIEAVENGLEAGK